MAKLQVFCVYDIKVSVFEHPFMMRNSAEAIRSFEELVSDDKTRVCRHPADFALMHLGSYDDQLGRYENLAAPMNLGIAASFVRRSVVDTPSLPGILDSDKSSQPVSLQ